MAQYLIEVSTRNWSCDCCGSGAHWEVDLLEFHPISEYTKLWGTSRNDQFGGVYRKGDDDTVQAHYYQELVEGMKKALEALGHSVVVEEYLDDTDVYYEEKLI